MRKFYSIISLVLFAFTNISLADNCDETNSASGYDDDPVVVALNSFPCTGGGTITGMTLDAAIGTYCPSWYSYDIFVNGSPIATQQCNQSGLDLSAYLPITSVSLQSSDEDDYSDAITLSLTLHITYTPASCAAPTSQSSSNLTFNGADLVWTDPDGTHWDLYIVLAGDPAPVAGTTPSVNDHASTSYTYSSGSANTSYDWYVRTDCGQDNTNVSTWIGPNTFTTYCNPFTSFPWTEDFENGGELPNCWTQEYVSSNVNWTASTGGYSGNPDSAHSGTYNGRFYSGNNNDDATILVSPPLDLSSLSNPILSFWHTQAEWAGDQDELRVYYKTSPGGSWILIAGQQYTQSIISWTEETNITLPSPSSTYFIGFEATSGFGFGVCLDDVTVEEMPVCLAPTLQTSSYPSVNGAILGWTDTLGTHWDLYITLVGEPAPIASSTPDVENTMDNPFTWTGGESNTEYNWYVRSDCGQDNTNVSTWTGPNTFRTLCDLVTSFSENFDAVDTPELPQCWDKVSTAGSAYTTNTNSNSSPNCLYMNGDNADQPVVAMPPVSNTGAGTYQLKFKLRANFTAGEVIEIGHLTDRSNAGSFVVDTTVTANTLTYVDHVIQLETDLGATSSIAIRHQALHGYSCSIDDVIWEQIPACPSPTTLNVSNLTQNGAELGWADESGSHWDIYIVPTGDPAPTANSAPDAANTQDNPYTWTDGSPNTEYDWYVRSDCGFNSPKIDYFWMAMDAPGNLLPGLSGGTTDDPGETGEWYLYDQLPTPWWNIWFYNDTLDTTRIKKIRMGFWIQSFDGINTGELFYVINWSDSTWQGQGFPPPASEDSIVRSPLNGPVVIDTIPQWIELYFTIPDFNPEWVSVDLRGENIIIEQIPVSPPPESTLVDWWNPALPGGIIVHECLPDSSLSTWAGPETFTTGQIPATLPLTEDFETWPNGWTVVNGTQTNKWHVGSAVVHDGAQSAYITDDDGTSNHYDIESVSVVYLYRDIDFTDLSLEFDLSFWWQGEGESTWDYLNIYLVETSVQPVAGALLNSGQIGDTYYNQQPVWTEANITIPGSVSGETRRLVISWRNDGTVGTQPPIAVDDIEITAIPLPDCIAPYDLYTSNISRTSADLNWDFPTESFFDVYYDLEGFDPATEGTMISGVPVPPYTLEPPLIPNTSYDWYVRTDCGFDAPKIDYFWMAMDTPGNLLPELSGGTSDDPGETGEWYLYDQLPTPWWNIWFYNDTLDTTRIKKIRMGFWIQSFDGFNTGQLFYVINWSDSTWQGQGFPPPASEDSIVRSPLNGPVVIDTIPQWIELYLTIPDFNPEWVSVDLWGENIIIEQIPVSPPTGSTLVDWWDPEMPGGIIVHECLSDSSCSTWTGPETFTTTCDVFTIPYFESFEAVTPPGIPDCMTVTNDNSDADEWVTSSSYPRSAPNSMYIRWNTDIAMDDWFYTPALSLDSGKYNVACWYRSSGADYPEKLEVKWGNAATAAGMTNGPIFDDNDIRTSIYLEGSGEFVVTSAGEYYVGWHGYSEEDMFYLVVDDISVRAVFFWIGNVSTAWNDAGNWDRDAIPGEDDLVVIPASPSGGVYPVVGNGMTAECYDLFLDNSDIQIDDGGTLIVKRINP